MAAGSPRMIIVWMQCILIYGLNKNGIFVDMMGSLRFVKSLPVSHISLVSTVSKSMHTYLGTALTPQCGPTTAGYSYPPRFQPRISHPSNQSYLLTRYQSPVILLLPCNLVVAVSLSISARNLFFFREIPNLLLRGGAITDAPSETCRIFSHNETTTTPT